jgi:hypothetical protein
VARLEVRILLTALSPFVVSAPWSFGVVRASSQIDRVLHPPSRSKAVDLVVVAVEGGGEFELHDGDGGSGCRSSGALSGDFPAGWGLLPIQDRSGAAADPAHHRLILVVIDIRVQRGLVVIFPFLEYLSVRLKL